jgi:hypothetical protein
MHSVRNLRPRRRGRPLRLLVATEDQPRDRSRRRRCDWNASDIHPTLVKLGTAPKSRSPAAEKQTNYVDSEGQENCGTFIEQVADYTERIEVLHSALAQETIIADLRADDVVALYFFFQDILAERSKFNDLIRRLPQLTLRLQDCLHIWPLSVGLRDALPSCEVWTATLRPAPRLVDERRSMLRCDKMPSFLVWVDHSATVFELRYMTRIEYVRRAARFEKRGLHIWPDTLRYRLPDGRRVFSATAQVQDAAGYMSDVPQRVIRFYWSEDDARMVARIAALIALEGGFRPRTSLDLA